MKKWLPWVLGLTAVAAAAYALRPRAAAPAAPAPTDATREDVISRTIDAAKATADKLRGALGDNPLAASLLNINPGLLTPITDPANSAAVSAITDEIASLQNALTKAEASWKTNHFGGVSSDEYESYTRGIVAQIQELQGQLSHL